MAESTIITGQFVRISQVPASLGERILARIIDYFLLFIYILATSYILGKLNIHAFSGSTFFLLFLLNFHNIICVHGASFFDLTDCCLHCIIEST